MADMFIYDMVRVPTGKKGGYYKKVLPEDLSAFLIDELIDRNGVKPEQPIELIMGNSIGTMGNMARYAALKSKLGLNVSSTTLDLQCGGAYQALRFAKGLLGSNENSLFMAGGMESNSLMPRRSYAQGDPRFDNKAHISKASFSPNSKIGLNNSAKNLAIKYGLTKDSLREWAVGSHNKAEKFLWNANYKKYIRSFDNKNWKDQTIRGDANLGLFKRLESPDLIDRTNTAHYTDGAAVALLGTKNTLDIAPMARIMDVLVMGIDPDKAPEGAIIGAEQILVNNGLAIGDIDLFEVNESFAVKPLAFAKHFKLDLKKINITGGNLAYGHPYAASGIINLMQLVLGLKLEGKKYGLLSAGVAGGFGVAVLIENIDS